MFLTEKELRDTFWINYNRTGRAKKWQFTLKFDVGHQGKEPFRNVFYNRITSYLVDPTGIQLNISEIIIF